MYGCNPLLKLHVPIRCPVHEYHRHTQLHEQWWSFPYFHPEWWRSFGLDANFGSVGPLCAWIPLFQLHLGGSSLVISVRTILNSCSHDLVPWMVVGSRPHNMMILLLVCLRNPRRVLRPTALPHTVRKLLMGWIPSCLSFSSPSSCTAKSSHLPSVNPGTRSTHQAGAPRDHAWGRFQSAFITAWPHHFHKLYQSRHRTQQRF